MKNYITTIDKYVTNQYLKVFTFLTVLFFILRVLILVFEDLKAVVTYEASTQSAIAYFLYSSPALLSEIIPVVMLISTIFVFHRLGKNGEIIGIMGTGASLIRIAVPIIITGLLMSVALWVWDEVFAAEMKSRAHIIMKYEIKEDQITRIKTGGIWMQGRSGRFFFIRAVDYDDDILYDMKVFQMDEKHENLISLLSASEADISTSEWKLTSGTSTIFDGTMVKSYNFEQHTSPFPETMRDLEDTQKAPERMSYSELKRYLEILESAGIKSNRYLTELHIKNAFPLSALIMSVWGIILCMKVREGMTIEIGSAILCLLGYFGLMAFCQDLGYKGILSPWFAAWFPNIVFLAGAAIGLLRRYTY